MKLKSLMNNGMGYPEDILANYLIHTDVWTDSYYLYNQELIHISIANS